MEWSLDNLPNPHTCIIFDNMATKPIPVRIPDESLDQIDAAARKLTTNRGRLLAFSVQTFTEYFEERQVCSMPPDWRDILKDLAANRPPAKAKAKKAK